MQEEGKGRWGGFEQGLIASYYINRLFSIVEEGEGDGFEHYLRTMIHTTMCSVVEESLIDKHSIKSWVYTSIRLSQVSFQGCP